VQLTSRHEDTVDRVVIFCSINAQIFLVSCFVFRCYSFLIVVERAIKQVRACVCIKSSVQAVAWYMLRCGHCDSTSRRSHFSRRRAPQLELNLPHSQNTSQRHFFSIAVDSCTLHVRPSLSLYAKKQGDEHYITLRIYAFQVVFAY